MDDLSETLRWSLLDLNSDKQVVGRADLSNTVVNSAGLALDPNWEPERHVNIVGWPVDEVESTQAAQELFAKHVCVQR
jgi:hypothetical protein